VSKSGDGAVEIYSDDKIFPAKIIFHLEILDTNAS
jgi:hypothetical protein